jgi:hypothetical protein
MATTKPSKTSPSKINAVPLDDLSEMLDDWRTHLRAMNRTPGTIDSYLRIGRDS